MPHLVSTTAECNGQHEMCCISSAISRNILVQVFASNSRALEVQQEVERTISQVLPHVRKQPVFKSSTSADLLSLDDTHDVTDVIAKGVPCLPAEECEKLYGQDPVDIARFGVLPPCRLKGRYRCIQPHADQSVSEALLLPPLRSEALPPMAPLLAIPDQNIRLVPCVERGKCPGFEYSTGNADHLERFGVLTQCTEGRIRCIFEVDLRIFSHQDNVNLPIFTAGEGSQPLGQLLSGRSLAAGQLSSAGQPLSQGKALASGHFFEPNAGPSSPAATVSSSEPTASPISGPSSLDNHQAGNKSHHDVEAYVQKAETVFGRKITGLKKKDGLITTAVTRASNLGSTIINTTKTTTAAVPTAAVPSLTTSGTTTTTTTTLTTTTTITAKVEVTTTALSLPDRSTAVGNKQEDTCKHPVEAYLHKAETLFGRKVAGVKVHQSTTRPSPVFSVGQSGLKKKTEIRASASKIKLPSKEHNFFQQAKPSPNEISAAEESDAAKISIKKSTTESPTKFKSFEPQPAWKKAAGQPVRVKQAEAATQSSEVVEAFSHLEAPPSITEDKKGNLVISGGTKVFHLHPGIAPPPLGPASQQSEQHHQQQQLSPSALRPQLVVQSTTGVPAQQTATVDQLFPRVEGGELDSQRVVEVLKSTRTAQLELVMDNRERMVLRVNNEELLPILEALQRALSKVRVEHV